MHTAAVIENRLITQLDPDSFTSVLRPKAMGAWVLHQLLDDLDFFVLFSSLGAVLGETGQANYAAANVFLDTLAAYRRNLGKPALSVNWGGWTGLGFAITEGGLRTIQYLEQQGIGSFTPEQGVAVLDYLMRRQLAGIGAPQAAVMPVNWGKFRSGNSSASQFRLLSDFFNAPDEQQDVNHSSSVRLLDELMAAKPEQRRSMLEAYLQNQIARVLKLELARVEPTKPLGMMGVDSLMGLELRNRLESDLGMVFSTTLVWNYPTIAEMAPYVANRLGVTLEANEAPVEAEPISLNHNQSVQAVIEEVNDLSDDEALRRLLGGA